MDQEAIVAGVELGGTKSIAVVGRGREILDRKRIATTTPDETLSLLAEQLTQWRERWEPQALGIASFGPIGLASGERRGRILATPKPYWQNVDVLGALAPGFDRVALHTDVTAAALAEGRWGAARDMFDYIYVTIGTGVGMGIVSGGAPVAGELHPEAGHLRVRRVKGDKFVGACPFHGDCLEGLVAGPAVAARAGMPAPSLKGDDPAWGFVADALAEAFSTLLLTLAPARIVVGGGLGVGQPQLLPIIRGLVVDKLGGYLPFLTSATNESRIVIAELGSEAGPLGALAMASDAVRAYRDTAPPPMPASR